MDVRCKNDNLEIAKGLMEDVKPLFINGFNDNLDRNIIRTLWDGDYNYTFSDTANITNIVSDQGVADNGKIFRIRGIDEEWNEVYRIVQLGSLPVSFEPLIRVNEVRQVGGEVNQGTVTVFINEGSAGNNSDVRAIIKPLFGRTQMGIFSVPDKTNAYINSFSSRVRRNGSSGDISSDVIAKVRLFGGDFVKEIIIPVHTEGGEQNITSDNYFKIPAKADIIIEVENDSSNNGVFNASLSGKLVKDDL